MQRVVSHKVDEAVDAAVDRVVHRRNTGADVEEVKALLAAFQKSNLRSFTSSSRSAAAAAMSSVPVRNT